MQLFYFLTVRLYNGSLQSLGGENADLLNSMQPWLAWLNHGSLSGIVIGKHMVAVDPSLPTQQGATLPFLHVVPVV